MRQRKIKHLEERLAAFDAWIVSEPTALRGQWSSRFPRTAPLFLEIGCGKGQFLNRQAAAHPDCNYIGVEGQASVALRALEKAAAAEADNLCFVLDYVRDLGDLFADGELAGIYLNFSDPWPKDRHAKRRLTDGRRLVQYARALEPGGQIAFKTDNTALFDFTLEQIRAQKMEILALSRDLHRSSYAAQNITTEYEDKFTRAGKPISYVAFRL